MNQVYLQLGSNLGDREIFLQTARDLISKELGLIEKSSKIYESTPWGVDDQDCFLNQVLLLSTSIEPHELLKLILVIEKKIGRIRIGRW